MFAFALYDADRGQPVPRPRPARREAALLRRAVRRRPDLRLRAQGPARPSAAAPDARARRRSRTISPSATSPTTPRSSRASRKLPAGHYLLRPPRPRRCRSRCAGGTSTSPSPVRGRSKALEEEMVERLRAAVRSRMVADVPLGAFLSGGVDSSAVVAFMAEASRGAVETCSIGFDEADHDETAYAAQVAELFATNHRTPHRRRRRFRPDRHARRRLRRAVRRRLGARHLPGLRAGAREGEGRAVRRRRRRGVRRLSPLPPVRRRGAGRAGCCPAPLRRAARARSATLYPKLDWAPQLLRAKTTLQALGQGERRGLCRTPSASLRPRIRRASIARLRAAARPRAEERYVRADERGAGDRRRCPAPNMPTSRSGCPATS